MSYRPHTAAETFERIRSGTEGHIATGDFLDDWRERATQEDRLQMGADPIGLPETDEQERWAAYTAAVVEHLCHETDTPTPSWTFDPRFVLRKPWFLWEHEGLRAWVLITTPAAFKLRNIFGGENMLDRV